ncbi:MAG: glycosyltransferase family 4 protein, partial [Hymenobacteraceae bacterium]|nr:glycosyltransferase family 4 protein [Hymenobacteraceae bacterium]MDX5513216.1 glycosyltransferase family 4 protein [Hymenobacteraceae bacterium]
MNVFLIPSWYPFPDKPMNGIFIYEQALAISRLFPDVNIGVSLWGQKDERVLLWSRDHVKNIKKLLNKPGPYVNQIAKNLIEYHYPEFTYTRLINNGNIQN